MGFLVEDNDLLTVSELLKKRKRLIKRKMQLLQQFREYILDYLRKECSPLDVEYELLDNNPNICFKDLKIGTAFSYEKIYFKFNLQTTMMTDYLKKSYGVITKLRDKNGDTTIVEVEKGCDMEHIEPRFSRRIQSNLSMASNLEYEKIIERIQLEVDNTLSLVFKGKLKFDDQEFEKLSIINVYLHRELSEVNKILNSKENDDNLLPTIKNR